MYSHPVINIHAITSPFFALVLAGYIAARHRMLPLEAIAGMNGFVLFFALHAVPVWCQHAAGAVAGR